MYISTTHEEMKYLSLKDKKLAKVIEKIGVIIRKKDENLFLSVIYNIIGQQISSKAKQTILCRLNNLCQPLNENTLLSKTRDELKSVGLSYRKVDYILDFANKVYSKEFMLEEVVSMDDEKVIERLMTLKGIGRWTAEMILIFCLDRKNIISFDDLGIKRGLKRLYHHKEVTKERFEIYRKRYSPYATAASLYLWEISKEKYQ